jgi:hypothetical protein
MTSVVTPALRRAVARWSAVAGLVAALLAAGFTGGVPTGAAAPPNPGTTTRDGASAGGQHHTTGRFVAPATPVLLAKRGGGVAQHAPAAVLPEFSLRRPFAAGWPVAVVAASPYGVQDRAARGRGPPARSS